MKRQESNRGLGARIACRFVILAAWLCLTSPWASPAHAGKCDGPPTLDPGEPRRDHVPDGVESWSFIATRSPAIVLAHMSRSRHPMNLDDLFVNDDPVITVVRRRIVERDTTRASLTVHISNLLHIVATRKECERLTLVFRGCRGETALGVPSRIDERELQIIEASLFQVEYDVQDPAKLLEVLRSPDAEVTLGRHRLWLVNEDPR